MLGDYIYINSYSGKPIIYYDFVSEYSEEMKERMITSSLAINYKIHNYLSIYFQELSIHQISNFLSNSEKFTTTISIYVHKKKEMNFSTFTLEDCDSLNDYQLKEIFNNIINNSSDQSNENILTQIDLYKGFVIDREVFILLLLNAIVYCYQHKMVIPVKFSAIRDGEKIITNQIDDSAFPYIDSLSGASFVNVTNNYKKKCIKPKLTEIINSASFISSYSNNFNINGRWLLNSKYVISSLEIPITELIGNIKIEDKTFIFQRDQT